MSDFPANIHLLINGKQQDWKTVVIVWVQANHVQQTHGWSWRLVVFRLIWELRTRVSHLLLESSEKFHHTETTGCTPVYIWSTTSAREETACFPRRDPTFCSQTTPSTLLGFTFKNSDWDKKWNNLLQGNNSRAHEGGGKIKKTKNCCYPFFACLFGPRRAPRLSTSGKMT